MKKIMLLIILFFVFQSCASVISEKSINVDELDKTELNQNNKMNYTVKEGEKISFATKVHGSVGMGAEYEIADEKILNLEKSETILDNPNFKGVGGDAGIEKFTFKAISKGKTKVKIKKIFRGNLEKETVFDIEVI